MTRTWAHTVQIEDSGTVVVPVTRQWMRPGPEEGGLVVLSWGEGMGLVRDQRKGARMGEVLVDPWVPAPNPDRTHDRPGPRQCQQVTHARACRDLVTNHRPGVSQPDPHSSPYPLPLAKSNIM
jgi:hypothetical protein